MDERTETKPSIRTGIRGLLSDRSGATAIEYGLIAGLIFLATVTSILLFSERVGLQWMYVVTEVLTSGK